MNWRADRDHPGVGGPTGQPLAAFPESFLFLSDQLTAKKPPARNAGFPTGASGLWSKTRVSRCEHSTEDSTGRADWKVSVTVRRFLGTCPNLQPYPAAHFIHNDPFIFCNTRVSTYTIPAALACKKLAKIVPQKSRTANLTSIRGAGHDMVELVARRRVAPRSAEQGRTSVSQFRPPDADGVVAARPHYLPASEMRRWLLFSQTNPLTARP